MLNTDNEKNSSHDHAEAFRHQEDNCYAVQPGDTLYAISRFYNVSLDDLVEINPHIEPDLLIPGQEIRIPKPPQPIDCSPGASAYIVQKGDTFYSIARRYKMHFSSLLKANSNLNPDALLTGQSICIPKISNIYASEIYGIKFMYPYRWSRTDHDRYAGIDGFFHALGISSDASLEEISRSEAYHKLKPYGAHPSITSTVIADRKACFILPSTDQPMEMRNQSALIINIGKQDDSSVTTCNYLMIRTDKNHLKDIADTLEFLGH